MAAPRSKDEKRVVPFIYNDTTKDYGAWDGSITGSGGVDLATEATLSGFATAFDNAVNSYISYIDDISVYAAFMADDLETIRLDTAHLDEIVLAVERNDSPRVSDRVMMIGAVLENSTGGTIGDAMHLNVAKNGILKIIPSSQNTDAAVIKEASGTISGVNGLVVFSNQDNSGRGVAPVTDSSKRLNVVVADVIPGTTATKLGKAEDAAHGSGDTGVMALAVRRDTPSSTAGADNDYLPLTTDSTGRVWTSTKVTELPDEGQQNMAGSISVAVASNQSPIPVRTDKFQQDTFTATGVGTTVDCTDMAVTYFGILVKGTGAAATTWTVAVEWSIDGTNWTATPLTHALADGDGVNKSGYTLLSGIRTARYFRANCTALTLGGATDIVVSIVGMRI